MYLLLHISNKYMENNKAEEFYNSPPNFQNIKKIFTNSVKDYKPKSHYSTNSLNCAQNLDSQTIYPNPNSEDIINFQNIQRISTNFWKEDRPESHYSINSLNNDQNSYNKAFQSNPNADQSINSQFFIRANNEIFNDLISLNEREVENNIKLLPNENEKNPGGANIKSIENQKNLKTCLKRDKKRKSQKKGLKIKCKNGKGNKNDDEFSHLSKKRSRGLSKQLFILLHLESNDEK